MTASLISQAFKKCKKEGRPALLTYTVAGDPTKKISLDILKSISKNIDIIESGICLLYTSPSPRDGLLYRMPSSA